MSAKSSVELIKAYALKPLNENELIEEPKIKMCQGIPQNLIMLAMALRVLPLEKIELEQVLFENESHQDQDMQKDTLKIPTSFA